MRTVRSVDHRPAGPAGPAGPAAPPTLPALYRAEILHRRRSPIDHAFRYGTLLWLIDVDHPPRLPRGLRWMARFDPDDHIDVHALLAGRSLPRSRVLMLTQARTLGYGFNPATFYWCYAGDELVATVVEVHNTYGERHAYVLTGGAADGRWVDKALFVSPFHPPEGVYRMRVSAPGTEIRADIALHLDGRRPFDAHLVARHRPLTAGRLISLWVRYPWAPLRVAALIRGQAFRLWRRGVPVHPR